MSWSKQLRSLLVLLFAASISISTVKAQSDPSTLYENAERAFSVAEYAEAARLLNQAVNIIGSSNPKIEGLRVQIFLETEDPISAKFALDRYQAMLGSRAALDPFLARVGPIVDAAMADAETEFEAQQEVIASQRNAEAESVIRAWQERNNNKSRSNARWNSLLRQVEASEDPKAVSELERLSRRAEGNEALAESAKRAQDKIAAAKSRARSDFEDWKNTPAFRLEINRYKGQKYMPYEKRSRWGLIDKNGDTRLDHNYLQLCPEHNPVRDEVIYFALGEIGGWEIYDADLRKSSYTAPHPTKRSKGENRCPLMRDYIEVEKNGLQGVMKGDFTLVAPLRFEKVEVYSDRAPYAYLFKVKQDGKWGLLAEDGSIIAPTKYDEIDLSTTLHNRFVSYRLKEKWGLLTLFEASAGERQPPLFDEKPGVNGEGVISGERVEIDKTGAIVRERLVKMVEGEDLISIRNNVTEMEGLFDKEGNQVLPREYASLGYLGNKLWRVTDHKDRLGVFGENGDWVIPITDGKSISSFDYQTMVSADAADKTSRDKESWHFPSLIRLERGNGVQSLHDIDGKVLTECACKITRLAHSYFALKSEDNEYDGHGLFDAKTGKSWTFDSIVATANHIVATKYRRNSDGPKVKHSFTLLPFGADDFIDTVFEGSGFQIFGIARERVYVARELNGPGQYIVNSRGLRLTALEQFRFSQGSIIGTDRFEFVPQQSNSVGETFEAAGLIDLNTGEILVRPGHREFGEYTYRDLSTGKFGLFNSESSELSPAIFDEIYWTNNSKMLVAVTDGVPLVHLEVTSEQPWIIELPKGANCVIGSSNHIFYLDHRAKWKTVKLDFRNQKANKSEPVSLTENLCEATRRAEFGSSTHHWQNELSYFPSAGVWVYHYGRWQVINNVQTLILEYEASAPPRLMTRSGQPIKQPVDLPQKGSIKISDAGEGFLILESSLSGEFFARTYEKWRSCTRIDCGPEPRNNKKFYFFNHKGFLNGNPFKDAASFDSNSGRANVVLFNGQKAKINTRGKVETR